MVVVREEGPIVIAVGDLEDALESLSFGAETSDLRQERDRLVNMLRSYVRPRLLDPSLTTNLVVAGPTGSGKSTLVNSLAGVDASATGALRPTTDTPLIVASRANAPVKTIVGGVECDLTFAESPLLQELSLVDTPDIDSTEIEHRSRAERMIDEADLLVFVTSALRYADDVPWQVLRRAMSRGVPIINVLNRVGSATSGSIVDFKRRLRDAGLVDDLIVITEQHIPALTHHLPETVVASLRERIMRDHLERLAESGQVVRRVLDAIAWQTLELTDTLDDLNHDFEALEAEMLIEAGERAEVIDLPTAGVTLHTPPPKRVRGWRARLWRRENRVGEEEMARRRGQVVERLSLDIESDIRTWMSQSDPPWIAKQVVPEIRKVMDSAINGWFVFVQRMVEPLTRRDHDLVELVLIDSTLTGSPSSAARLIFGDDSDEMVHRSIRELRGRIGVVYSQTVSGVVAGYRLGHGHFDTEEVKSAVADLVTTVGA